jgi:hypothetical protein
MYPGRPPRKLPRAYEHTFVTSRGHPRAEFKRALDRGKLWIAKAVAREMAQVSLDDALKLVHLYAEKESPKHEAAAMKWLRRNLDERSPTLKNFAKVVRSLERQSQ